MSSAIDNDWLDARIARTKELIVIYEDALSALAAGAQSYSLDTGQTRQTVTKQQVGSLRNVLDMLENRLATLDARRCGSGSRVNPSW